MKAHPQFNFGTTANVLFTSLVFGRRDALQIQRLDDGTVMSISLEGQVILVLKTLAERVVGKFYFNY